MRRENLAEGMQPVAENHGLEARRQLPAGMKLTPSRRSGSSATLSWRCGAGAGARRRNKHGVAAWLAASWPGSSQLKLFSSMPVIKQQPVISIKPKSHGSSALSGSNLQYRSGGVLVAAGNTSASGGWLSASCWLWLASSALSFYEMASAWRGCVRK